jgi:hypothetical protein
MRKKFKIKIRTNLLLGRIKIRNYKHDMVKAPPLMQHITVDLTFSFLSEICKLFITYNISTFPVFISHKSIWFGSYNECTGFRITTYMEQLFQPFN